MLSVSPSEASEHTVVQPSKVQKWPFVVYLPDSNEPDWAYAEFVVIEGNPDTLFTVLYEEIRRKYSRRRNINGMRFRLLKCGEVLAKGKGEIIFQRVKDWFIKSASSHMYIQQFDTFGDHFPNGPSSAGQQSSPTIDAIIVNEGILASLEDRPRFVNSSSSPQQYHTHLSAQPIPFITDLGRPFHSNHRAFGWVIEPDTNWHKFYHFWAHRDPTVQESQEMSENSVLTLAINEQGYHDPTQRLASIPHNLNRLYIRKEYRTLANRLREFLEGHLDPDCQNVTIGARKQLLDTYKDKGIVLTGHPGTGKTTWLWYMLTHCLMRRENVLFYSKEIIRLFFEGRVYKAVEATPSWIKHEDFFVWSLIDSDNQRSQPPACLTDKANNVFPVQASLPNEARYSTWIKECSGRIWGMNLWSLDEMIEALKIHKKYEPFMDGLRKALTVSDAVVRGGRIVDLKDFPGAVRTAVQFSYDASGCWVSLSAEDVFRRLVKDAMYQFGDVPRDITEAVFVSYESGVKKIQNALTLSETSLDQLMNGSPSHQLFAIQPVGPDQLLFEQDDTFVPKFKSESIGKMVMKFIGLLEVEYTKKFVNIFKLFPESSQLAGWIFQSLACRMLASSEVDETMIQMILTEKSDRDMKLVYETPDFQAATRDPFPNGLRSIATCTFPNDVLLLREGHLLENCMWVPATPNHPLFDAFFVDIKVSLLRVLSTIWIVQTSLSHDHSSSDTGYEHVRAIMGVVERRAREVYAEKHQLAYGINNLLTSFSTSRGVSFLTTVKYLYVCPRPETPRKWRMPEKGWNSVSGQIYCLHLDVSLPDAD